MTKYLTLENILKVLLAIAVGFMLYKIFFKKSETYYDYRAPNGDESGYAYPMDYETQEMIDEYAAEDVPDYEDDEEVVDEEEEVFDEEDYEDEIVDEVEIDANADDAEYDYEDTDEPYDDSADAEEDVDIAVEEDQEDDFSVPDEVYEEADAENTDAYEYLYADEVADELQENFTLYSNMVGVDTSYD
ncbi:hypothetical protein NY2A_B553R [Paramecium bursaria Chlorella virus NY2A]|uniref:Uncharacterized protein B553R n=1 Tax=Paramecium bursaria Chlorella virus NY2A TaxID=46021 RepID=A7IX78_PBCVN|nr:hypothetical protein NY2A_B553R [Paramecium bursaria Chlorella virus NY2A]ABT14952.1 hypothetical protein NY2A_B553R [Paramecium bursaria Chlorella virus NY2A]